MIKPNSVDWNRVVKKEKFNSLKIKFQKLG